MAYAFNDDKSKFSLNPIEEDITNTIESIAPVESVVATANHSIGDYFMLGNTLMVATSAIAAGETITTSNATPATIQSQIDALWNSLGNLIHVETVIAVATAGNADSADRVVIKAPDVDGYHFAFWMNSATVGYVNWSYVENPSYPWTGIWYKVPIGSDRQVMAIAIYFKDV